MIQTIKVFDDRKVSPSRLIVGNQFENGIERIQFELPENMLEKGYRYLILNKPSEDESYPIPLDENNIFYVDSRLTYYLKGVWIANVVLVKDEIKEDNLNPDTWTFISDNITLIVKSNYINNEYLGELPLPENLKIIYDDLLKMYETIKSDYENGNFNGRDGKSAYELAVENGFEGTEEEWLESLRYDHSDEFKQLAEQVKQDANSAADSATKAENAMNEANTTAQENVEAINQASTNAQNAITTTKDNSVQAVQSAQQTAENAIGTKQTEAVQAVDTAKTSATQEITEQKESAVSAITQERSEAIEAIETGKTNALETITTAKDNAIEEIENTGVPLEDIEKLAIKETATGNPTIISDSADWRLQNLNVYGQSEQASTTGAQLLDSSLFESNDITKNGIRFVKNSDGSISVSGKSTGFSTYNLGLNRLENGTYFINGSKNNAYVYVNIKKESDEKFIENASFTIDGTETSIILYIQINPDFTVSDIIYPMLNLGDTSKPFEPYTGGKPSPSLDYKQEMISKEVSEIKLYGTNLFDLEKEKLVPNTNWNEERQCFYPKAVAYYIGMRINEIWDIAHESDNLFRVSFDIKADKNGKVRVYTLGNRQTRLENETGFTEYVDVTQEYVRHYICFSTLDKRGQPDVTGQGDNCGLSFYGVVNDEMVIPEVKNICISVTENTEYIPFESQTITLSEPITLRGIPVESGGNVTIDGQQYVSDVICEKDGVYGVERNTIPFSLLVKNMNNNDDYPGWKPIEVVDKILPPQANDANIVNTLCNIVSRTIYGRRDQSLIYFVAEGLGKNQTELKEQYPDLSVNFIAINYQPTFEPLPEEIQAQYKALKSYYPNTVIQSGAFNEVEYVADTKTWIENKLNGITELALGIGGK